ncbi:MAG: radical SAM protein [Acidobacteria bacterium]|nr:radical SAM protein [Acidobacteriota bacterium]
MQQAAKTTSGNGADPFRATIPGGNGKEHEAPRVVVPAAEDLRRHLSAAGSGGRSLRIRARNLAGRSLSAVANLAWHAFQAVNRRIPFRTFQPAWAPAPLLKSYERTFPPLGFPRETDSLCPRCVLEVRGRIMVGDEDWRVLVEGNPGEIRAKIVERDGKVYMEKECPKHGRFSDLMAMDVDFLRLMEKRFPGRDFRMAPDDLHNHGSSSIRYGRGAVLTIDLTNRCNMMCDPCFMDANQVGYVHELTWEDIKELLDNAITVKPKRQMSVQFSGGEPTISPFFLDAVAYARKVGYDSVQAATNGIRLAQDPEFARKAGRAGLRLIYLQFDGVGNEANQHRKVGNLFDVKLKAIENAKAAGIDITLVMTVVNTVNNDQIGPAIKFAIENIDKINAVSFQPVSFTGRDDEIDDERRARQRYTLSHLAHDVKAQLGVTEPLRDWYPLSASGPFSDLKDSLDGAKASWGSMKCGCHPNCGVGTYLLVNQMTHQAVPIADILNVERIVEDVKLITDCARGRRLTALQFALSVLRNFRIQNAPENLGFRELVRVIDGHTGRRMRIADRCRFDWRLLMVAGMWFQDLFNYDFRRTEMCIIPYATQMGEISFCAYNTGAGWRQVVETIHRTATTAEWYAKQGRHPVYAGGRTVPLTGAEQEAEASRFAAKTAEKEAATARRQAGGNGNGSRKLRLPMASANP